MARARSPHAYVTRLRRLSASLPETAEVEAWGHPTFRAGKKIFATFGAIVADLVETSYRMVALKRMVKALDAAQG